MTPPLAQGRLEFGIGSPSKGSSREAGEGLFHCTTDINTAKWQWDDFSVNISALVWRALQKLENLQCEKRGAYLWIVMNDYITRLI